MALLVCTNTPFLYILILSSASFLVAQICVHVDVPIPKSTSCSLTGSPSPYSYETVRSSPEGIDKLKTVFVVKSSGLSLNPNDNIGCCPVLSKNIHNSIVKLS